MPVFKIFLTVLLFLNANIVKAHIVHEKYIHKRIKFYPLYYNALQLSQTQIPEFEYIIEEYNKKYEKFLNTNFDNKHFKEISAPEEKELKEILDKRQRIRFRLIRHLERIDIKRSLKPKDYYKLNPRMGIFGNSEKK